MPKTHPEDTRLVKIKAFGTNPGALAAWLFLPSITTPKTPLVVALHGCTQTAEGYAAGSGWSQLAEKRGFAVLYPEQQRSNNANLCFNWFEPGDTQRGRGEAASIKEMVDYLVLSQGIDPGRVFITGLSAGGAMANVMLSTYPEIFAGGAIIGGLPYGVAGNVGEAFERMQGRNPPDAKTLQSRLSQGSDHKGPWPTISVWHGTHDQTVRPKNAAQIVEQWKAVHRAHEDLVRTETLNGHLRTYWVDMDGRAVLEFHAIKGMGHGVPLATRGEVSLGEAGPYMLEAGISSTARIARSWELAIESDISETEASYTSEMAADVPDLVASIIERTLRRNGPRANPAEESRNGRVTKVINDALRAAGLLR